MLAYQVKKRGRPLNRGVTNPSAATVAAVLKSDSGEVPTCVYNEFVAQRLAELLRLPVAHGVLIKGDGVYQYASFVAASEGGRLPDMEKRLAHKAATRYPRECAGIFVFDVFIGNWDRSGNIKAALSAPTKFFCAFDHSHCLLFSARTPSLSILELAAGEMMMNGHMFRDVVEEKEVAYWVSKLSALPESLIVECCCPGIDVNGVNQEVQTQLAQALITRRDRLETTLAQLARLDRKAP